MWRRLQVETEQSADEVSVRSVTDSWSGVWSEALQGSGAGTVAEALRRISSAVVVDATDLLCSRNWLHRERGVEVIMSILGNKGHLLESASDDLYSTLGPALFSLFHLLRGPYWKGRNRVVELFGEIVDRFPVLSITTTSSLEESDSLLVTSIRDSNCNAFDEVILKYSYLIGADSLDPVPALISNTKMGMEAGKDSVICADDPDRILGSDASPVPPQISKISGKHLKICAKPLMKFLFREISLSDKAGLKNDLLSTRKIYAAKCLLKLPWIRIREESSCPLISWVIDSVFEIVELNSCLKSLSRANSAASTPNPSQIQSIKVDRVKRPTNSQLFGNRYGAALTGGDPKTRASSVRSRSTLDSVSLVVSQTNMSPQEVERGLRTYKTEPAVRALLLDCLSKLWPSTSPDESELSRLVQDQGRRVLKWVGIVLKSEPWSVKRSLMQLVGCVVSSLTLSISEVESVLDHVSVALSDVKYHQVRIAGMKCLLHLVDRTCDKNMEVARGRIRSMTDIAFRDENSEIMEVARMVLAKLPR